MQHPHPCDCCSDASTLPRGASQTLSELDFARSAAAAAALGDLARLRRLIEKDAASAVAVPRGSSDGFSPLHFAVRCGNNAEEAVAMLLGAGADPNAETKAGKATPLHRCAYAGDSTITTMLLEAGADATRVDADGETAAHKAARQGHEEVMEMLLAAAPETREVRDARKGRTPAEALRERKREGVESLKEKRNEKRL